MGNLVLRNRIPRNYFLTSGKGESDITVHAGSFDMALMKAGIHNVNIIMYSSILPPTAREIDGAELPFGCVAETIMAVQSGSMGERVTAGLTYGWVYKNNKKLGGLVAECHGDMSRKGAEDVLSASLNGMFTSRFDPRHYKLKNVKMKIESFFPKKKFGTAIVAIVFTDHTYSKE
jgi:arginine decarboxylase